MSDAQKRVQELDLTKDRVDEPAGRVDEAEKALSASQERVQYVEGNLSKLSNEKLSKDAEAANERERLSKLGGQVTSLSADLKQARAQNMTDKHLLEGVKTALALQKTASQQRISNYIKECEKCVADKAAVDAKFRQYRAEMDTKPG